MSLLARCLRTCATSSRSTSHVLTSRRGFSVSTSRPADAVKIVEVGPRDGLQNEKTSIPAATKTELVNCLAGAGLSCIEAGSFVHPKWVPQMAASDKVLSSILSDAPATSTPITYQWLLPNSKGLDNFVKVMEAHKPERAQQHEVSIFLAATESFSQKNTNCSIAQSLERFAPLIASAKQSGYSTRAYISVALGCPFEGPEVNPHTVADLTIQLLEMGAREVSVADTTGMGTAPRTRQLLQTLQQAGVQLERDIALHFHDTFGQALINTLIGLEYGVRTYDSAVGGLGGCPYSPGATGNLATEDLLYTLQSLGQEVEGNIDLEEISGIGEWICGEIGKGNASGVGRATMARVRRREAEEQARL